MPAAFTVEIDGDWDLSTVAWVVFIACLCSILLSALLIALVARYRNQRSNEDDDWQVNEQRQDNSRQKKISATETVRPIAMRQTENSAESAYHPNVGSQSSISPIVVSHEEASTPSRPYGHGNSLSQSVPAVNVTPSAPHQEYGSRRMSARATLAPQSVRSSDRAPSPIIWGEGGSQPSQISDPVYGYSRLASGRTHSASTATRRETGDYDDVLEARMRSHTVTTPRQSHHYDAAV